GRLRSVLQRGSRVRDRARLARRAAGPRPLSSVRVIAMTSGAFRTVAAVVVAVAAWLSPDTAPAAAQEPLTLSQAVAIAQERGHQAQAAPASRDAARFRDRAFFSRLLPQLSLSGTMPRYNRSIIPVLQPDGSTLFRPQDQTN